MQLSYKGLNRQEFEMKNNVYGEIKKDTDPSDMLEVDKSTDNKPCGTTETFYEVIPGDY